MIVADASLVVNGLVTRSDARQWLVDHDLYAPHLIDLEVLHALRRSVRLQEISDDDAKVAMLAHRHLGITRYPVYGLTERIWELRDNLTPYDAAYVVVAEALECPLVTADAKLAAAPGVDCEIVLLPA